MSPVTHLLYLHGFRSSPWSTKAQRMAREVARRQADGQHIVWACPQLPPSPAQALQELQAVVAAWPREDMAVMGSSLGGFYATVLAEGLDCRALLINPAVEPARDLAGYIGEQSSWHDPQDRFFFRPEYVEALQALRPAAITRPGRYFTLIASGDEVLDAQEMRQRYAGCGGVWVEGSDHALSNFDEFLPSVFHFLEWPA
jgi:uncharacterized protein